ncbi:hypothetical protein CFC21_000084 [Triticum aestivum]|uniref:Neprosin PEP catalytic domain-containing protein n=1 Tax=Triticum aestivum TaxID=4565 RepID=A0A3B5XT89_WHEAT|nr:hypothetical protein CFC21_000084 [Triticum aestivum]
MGGDYVVISVLLCFLCITFHLTCVESVDVDVNLQTNEKNTTLLRRKPFHFPWRADITNEGSGIVSHISPSLYHNRDIRFFTYWTKDLKSKGCYNLQCPGFVSASRANLVPGQAMAPPSIYGKEDHYVRLSLNKDPNSGDWVVYHHDLQKPSFLGHFPNKLCPGTRRIQALTGFVNYLKNAHGPPMGSSHFPDYDDKRSAYFKHIQNYNPNGHSSDLFGIPMIKLVDRPDCYGANNLFLEYKKGYMFNYGGPGGCVG